ncbi:aminoglycoside phosphotransferase family protein [Arthrobacter agilis]|uniref:aminoglycoside phosphotransferase family protein n=1 Tax=Arthrobacter agilis TaxID=37921 RepID=UPI002366E909|nr:aminoglycoside phosphotransferase family protein [Arthrobacter agilis]WDF34321.1 aminoglycoside phosphotransferase family protein [Arthrobacter agilis]
MAVMPEAEVTVEPGLVVALLRAQAPDLAHLPVRLAGGGWDNTLFRLGEDLVVRLPRRKIAEPLMVAEQQWLPGLAADLSVPTSAPVRIGHPGSTYPWHWSVCRWIDGITGVSVPRRDRESAAVPLARFLAEFHRPAPADAPVSPVGRGGPLEARDDVVRARLAVLGTPASPRLLEVWEHSVAAPAFADPPLWLHGDLHPANTVLRPEGGLAGVVDFGDLCAGDPATDLAVAWLHFDASGRSAFRAEVERHRPTNAATWDRARGWAVSMGSALVASSDDAPAMLELGRGILAEVLCD